MRFHPLIAPLALVVSACSSTPGVETASIRVDAPTVTMMVGGR